LFGNLRQLDYHQAKAMLTNYSGVGPKVADCILLFSAGKHEAFPIDTWIKKTLIRRYGLSEHQPKNIQSFIEMTFGDFKGFANQYLFYFERSKQG
jgi:N-glycosylase/DNA lyase